MRGLLDPFGVDDWEFGPGDEIPAQGFLVLVGIEAQLFRALNAVPASEPVVGPFGGRLDNGGERLKLLKPAAVEGRLAFISVDEVRYDQSDPWPTTADGSGRSLERIVAFSFGDDVVNWSASTRFGGTPGAPNTTAAGGRNLPPRSAFTASPPTGEEPLEVFFNAGRSYDLDGTIVRYSWDFDDAATAEGRTAVHTFRAQGLYIVQLTVEDDEGETDTETLLITVRVDSGGAQIPGDGNQDSLLDIGDGVTLLLLLFRTDQVSLPCAGDSVDTGSNRVLLDINNDNTVDMSDAVHVLSYLFRDGTPPILGTECIPIPGCPDVCAP